MKRPFRTITFAALIIIVAGLIASALWLYSQIDTPYYGASSEEVFLDIPRRASTRTIADLLVKSGVLRSRLPFILYVRYTNKGRHIQAGEYRFAKPATPRQVAERLVKGDITFNSVTVPEGLTANETIDLLAQAGLGDREEMEQLLRRTDWISDMDPDAQNLEGYLFPETYRFSRRAKAEAVLKTMVEQFRTRVSRLKSQYPLPPGWTIRRIVVLASMVEKEVKSPQERPIVASVLVNRLQRKMPLACDATIIYAMKLAGTYEGRLGRADLVMQSPYNSYLRPDLPPGPICNPGEMSIRAALNPAETEYLYYVSRNDGTHHFSRDYRSHLNAVNRFQKPAARRR